MLSIEQLSTFINVSDKMLTVKELLNNMNYPMNELYIDKFWNNIENDKWIYIDNDMLLWVGYNCQDNYDNKKKYIKLLKDNFDDYSDYKLINNKEFLNISIGTLKSYEDIDTNVGNKTKHLITSPDCFKQSLMLLRAKKIERKYI